MVEMGFGETSENLQLKGGGGSFFVWLSRSLSDDSQGIGAARHDDLSITVLHLRKRRRPNLVTISAVVCWPIPHRCICSHNHMKDVAKKQLGPVCSALFHYLKIGPDEPKPPISFDWSSQAAMSTLLPLKTAAKEKTKAQGKRQQKHGGGRSNLEGLP